MHCGIQSAIHSPKETVACEGWLNRQIKIFHPKCQGQVNLFHIPFTIIIHLARFKSSPGYGCQFLCCVITYQIKEDKLDQDSNIQYPEYLYKSSNMPDTSFKDLQEQVARNPAQKLSSSIVDLNPACKSRRTTALLVSGQEKVEEI